MIKTKNISAKNFFITASKKNIILKERKELLLTIATTIAKEYIKNEVVNLTFICTHNSRRSQFAQVWSFFASHYFDLNIESFSGGTEITAFHRNTVKSLQKSGFNFNLIDFNHQNPTYSISFDETNKDILGFSKLYDNSINKSPFIAITTCNNADENCPFISTASHRFHVPFVDPKIADGTENQEKKYLETNKIIASELYFMFSNVKKMLVNLQ